MREINTIMIAGAGTMGASMAETFAKYNHDVILYDISEKALEKAKDLIRINQLTEVAEKMITSEQSCMLLEKIHYSKDMGIMKKADFVIEAIVENMDTKKSFWKTVSENTEDDVLYASNTSGLSITEIAKVIRNPENFVGMHWINPPHIIPLVEIIKGEETNEEVTKVIYDICEKVGKKPVIVKNFPGFVLNRISLAILRECLNIAEKGIASIEDIDKVMKYGLGIRYACLGPFEIADHGGLDIFDNIAEYLFKDLSNAEQSFYLLKNAVENGELGIKTGKGFYDYSDGRDKEAIMYRDKMYTKISKCLFMDEEC